MRPGLVAAIAAGLVALAIARPMLAHSEEDSERTTLPWRTGLSPGDYWRALEATGQLERLKSPVTTNTSAWTSIGPVGDPVPGAGFETILQANNGRIRSFWIGMDGADLVVYVGGSSGGLWRAVHAAGPIWTSLGDQLPNPSVAAFALHPNNINDILVGTGDFKRYSGAGMLHSVNGSPWSLVSLPTSPGAFFRILYLPGNSNVVLAATDNGLLRSPDGPAGTWDVRLTGFVSDLVIDPTNPNIQYCCRGGVVGVAGVYKSTNGGLDWTTSPIYAAPVPVGNGRIAVCQGTPSTLVYVYESGGSIAGVVRSTTSGSAWSALPLPNASPISEAIHALAVAIRPNNPSQIFLGSAGLQTLTVGGSWSSLRDPSRHDDQTQLVFSPLTGNNVLWICNDGGIFRWDVTQTNSVSWNGNQTTGLSVSQFWGLDAQRDLRAGGRQDDGAIASSNGGLSWRLEGCCDAAETEITDDLATNFLQHIRDFFSHTIARYTFNGSSVGIPHSGVLDGLFYDRFRGRVISLSNDGAQTRVLETPSATGTSWTNLGSNVPPGLEGLAGNDLHGQNLYSWTWDNDLLTVLVWGGSQWTALRTVQLQGKIVTVYASPEHPNECWAGLSSVPGAPKLAHTKNNWLTWGTAGGSLTEVGAVRAIVAPPFEPGVLYVGTDVGVYQTLDGGATWNPFQDGLPIVMCNALRYVVDHTFAGNDKLIAATYGRGVYERAITAPGTAYVDPRNLGTEDGTYEHAFDTFVEGQTMIPDQGRLGLYQGTYIVPPLLDKRMKIHGYGGPVRLDR